MIGDARGGAALSVRHVTGKPIKFIVPFPPGGVADIVGRPLAAAGNRRNYFFIGMVLILGAAGATLLIATHDARVRGAFETVLALEPL